MVKTELKNIFPTAWGILADYRHKIESGSFGALERVEIQAFKEKFMSMDQAAYDLGCPSSVVLDVLKTFGGGVRYVMQSRNPYFLAEDIKKIPRPVEIPEIKKKKSKFRRK